MVFADVKVLVIFSTVDVVEEVVGGAALLVGVKLLVGVALLVGVELTLVTSDKTCDEAVVGLFEIIEVDCTTYCVEDTTFVVGMTVVLGTTDELGVQGRIFVSFIGLHFLPSSYFPFGQPQPSTTGPLQHLSSFLHVSFLL